MYHLETMGTAKSSFSRSALSLQWGRLVRVLLFVLVGALTVGCSMSRRFTGRAAATGAAWPVSSDAHRGIGAKVLRRANDDLLLALGMNRAIKSWSILVEVNTQKPNAWVVVGRLANTVSVHAARAGGLERVSFVGDVLY